MCWIEFDRTEEEPYISLADHRWNGGRIVREVVHAFDPSIESVRIGMGPWAQAWTSSGKGGQFPNGLGTENEYLNIGPNNWPKTKD